MHYWALTVKFGFGIVIILKHNLHRMNISDLRHEPCGTSHFMLPRRLELKKVHFRFGTKSKSPREAYYPEMLLD